MMKSRNFVCLTIAQCTIAVSLSGGTGYAENKPKVKYKFEFRSDTFQFDSIGTVVIFPVRPDPEKVKVDPTHWRPQFEMPADSVRHELAYEIKRAIRRRNPVIETHLMSLPDSGWSDSVAITRAVDSLGADAVMLIRATESWVVSGTVGVNVARLSVEEKGGKAKATIEFALYAGIEKMLVWRIECEAESQSKLSEADGWDTPAVDAACAIAHAAAISKLPF